MYWKHVDDLMKDQRDVVSRIRDFNSYANKKSIRILKKDPRSSTFLNKTNHVKDSNKKRSNESINSISSSKANDWDDDITDKMSIKKKKVSNTK